MTLGLVLGCSEVVVRDPHWNVLAIDHKLHVGEPRRGDDLVEIWTTTVRAPYQVLILSLSHEPVVPPWADLKAPDWNANKKQ